MFKLKFRLTLLRLYFILKDFRAWSRVHFLCWECLELAPKTAQSLWWFLGRCKLLESCYWSTRRCKRWEFSCQLSSCEFRDCRSRCRNIWHKLKVQSAFEGTLWQRCWQILCWRSVSVRSVSRLRQCGNFHPLGFRKTSQKSPHQRSEIVGYPNLLDSHENPRRTRQDAAPPYLPLLQL